MTTHIPKSLAGTELVPARVLAVVARLILHTPRGSTEACFARQGTPDCAPQTGHAHEPTETIKAQRVHDVDLLW
jgi:hypothetical protein